MKYLLSSDFYAKITAIIISNVKHKLFALFLIKNLLGCYYFSGNARFFGFARIICYLKQCEKPETIKIDYWTL